MAERLSLDLVDNALDFLLDASQRASGGVLRDYKYAVLHLAAAIELILKARLEREHWALLFTDIDKASPEALRNGRFRSVDIDAALHRLRNICSIAIEMETEKRIKGLQELRNQIQHSRVDIGATQVKARLVEGTNLFMDFCRQHLPDVLADADPLIIGKILDHLGEFREFVENRRSLIQPELDAASYVCYCPRCDEPALCLSNRGPRCAFCGHQPTPEAISEDLGDGKAGMPCMTCGADALSCILIDGGMDMICVCASCGATERFCPYCEQRFVAAGDWCPSCLESVGGDVGKLEDQFDLRFAQSSRTSES